MSRTFKDKREVKVKRKKFKQMLWTKKFEINKLEGDDEENEELDFCPECNFPTDFEAGLLTCSKCGWGNFYPANGLEEDFEPLEYPMAA
ncbi:hypothetical protein DOM22_05650 [Bdellovibrio sp. ZAP7]|uniref:hypothetical protein n=1 Tax=Bdellovibrio sp. ZAP7 TaxID=2231053 RepID=UPI001159A3F0|nr:hypothetical protein [Bdellovibrio sp. ZAP7]QDK44681.1 hypothetical protein DOM22_05650 [Bdellovibrio sp. ZAP7]